MKIIKQFEDFEFFDSLIEGPNDPERDKWTWGLGDDGEVYFRSSDNANPQHWYALKEAGRNIRPSSLKVMKRLVKEFGHLLIWL